MVAIALAIVVLMAIGWKLSRRRIRPSFLARPSRAPGGGGVPRHLMGQLHRLTRDRRVSERLIRQLAAANPRRSRRWCVEKAIYDLQRDRRS